MCTVYMPRASVVCGIFFYHAKAPKGTILSARPLSIFRDHRFGLDLAPRPCRHAGHKECHACAHARSALA